MNFIEMVELASTERAIHDTIVVVQKLRELLENNRRWAERMTTREPQFFARLAAQQTPRYQ